MEFRDALNLILLLCGLLVFYRIIKGTDRLEFWHLLSTTSDDGKIWTDNDKVGQMIGLVVSTWIICYLTVTEALTVYYLGVWLIYAAGMTAFAKWARAVVADKFGARVKEPEKTDPPGTISATSPQGGTMKMTP